MELNFADFKTKYIDTLQHTKLQLTHFSVPDRYSYMQFQIRYLVVNTGGNFCKSETKTKIISHPYKGVENMRTELENEGVSKNESSSIAQYEMLFLPPNFYLRKDCIDLTFLPAIAINKDDKLFIQVVNTNNLSISDTDKVCLLYRLG